MAAVNKTTISTTLNAEIRTGLSDTTALGLRNLINQILDSYVNTKDGGLFYEQLVGYASLLTITDQKSFVHKKYVDDLIAAINLSPYFNKSADDTDDISVGATNKFVTVAEKTILSNTSGTNTGDNAVNTLYSGLVSNATHTGEVTGATSLTLDKTAITNKTLVTADASDHVLIADASDSGNLKKVLVSDFGGASTLIVANRQTASYTLVLTDATKLVEMNVATANNCTIPLNATVAFPIGTQILVDQTGAGQTTLVATGGVTLNYTDTLKTRVQNSTLCLIKIGTDEWDISGDTEPLVPAIVQADLDALLITANNTALLYASSF